MREAIILAGGKGTRIQHILPGLPKCMAPINGLPFISYILEYLIKQKTDHFIFSLGHMHEEIANYLSTAYPQLNKTLVIEDSALGTGGAILKSLQYAKSNAVFILNGDTYFPVSLDTMQEIFENNEADLVLASTLLSHPNRFGTISLDRDQRITSFHEKRELAEGFINGGSYLLSKHKLIEENKNEVFSFEKEILESKIHQWAMYASIQEALFIDIGIPEDYQRAQGILPAINSIK